MKTLLKIGSRGSPLALAQAEIVKYSLIQAHGWDEDACEIVPIRTRGDIIQDRRLSEAGGKGLFTKEIEVSLADGEVDIAVHSLKDMAADDPDGLMIRSILQREMPHDALITPVPDEEGSGHTPFNPADLIPRLIEDEKLPELPFGSQVGTASLRRQAQLLRLRPDLKIGLLRGNVARRIEKVQDGTFSGTLLACAGLRRLNLGHKAVRALPLRPFLPAVAQGAIAVQVRSDDKRVHNLIDPIHHEETGDCVQAERAFLAQLNGSCRMPIAGYAWIESGILKMKAEVLSHTGQFWVEHEIEGSRSMALLLGREMGYILRQKMMENGLDIEMD